MRRIADRDTAALAAFYDRYSALVMGVCLRVLHERADAEDLLVDIFEEVWERFERYDAKRANPLTYLMTLTRSRAIDRLRARPKQRPASLELGEPNVAQNSMKTAAARPDGPMELMERRSLLDGAMQSLEPAQREAIEHAFFDGLSHSEIAAKLNKPLGTIKTQIRLGLIRLRDCLRNKKRDDL